MSTDKQEGITIEQLLKPRYKVIADWPGMYPFVHGGFIVFNGPEVNVFISQWQIWEEDNVKRYPHLFRKLEWWEDREEKDMPEYLKTFAGNSVRKVGQIVFDKVMFVGGSVKNIKHWLPATKEEYLAFKTK